MLLTYYGFIMQLRPKENMSVESLLQQTNTFHWYMNEVMIVALGWVSPF
jgi:hypothetical protein